ncbi:MAG: FHA domain-containing protein [Sumerlaeia bacterium]
MNERHAEDATILDSANEQAAMPNPVSAQRTFLFALSTLSGPRLIAFQITNLLIGRLPDNHLSLNHTSVSRRHARISLTNKGMMIQDMGSQNGTTINGIPVKSEMPIRPGDVLRIGYVPLFYFGFVQENDPPKMEIIENSIELAPNAPQG